MNEITVAILGDKRSGMSYAGLRIAEQVIKNMEDVISLIKCRYCGYSGGPEHGINPIEANECGVISILCSRCKMRTVIKFG